MPDKKIIDLDALARYNEHIDEELALKADASDLEGYLPLTGGTIDGELVVQESEDNPNHNSTSIQNDVSRHHSNTRTTFDDVEISSDSITITHGRVRAYQKAQISQEGVCVTSGGTIHDYNPNEYLIEFPTDEWDDATGDHTFATREWVSVRVPEFTKTKSIDAGDYFLTCTADYDAVSGGLVKSYKWTKKEGDTFVFDPEYFVDVDTLDTADSDLVVIPASLNSMPILAGTNSVPYKLLGNTASFNQLALISRSTTTENGITFTIDIDNGTITCNGTATADETFFINQPLTIVGGHKYLIKGCPSGGSADTFGLSGYYIGSEYGSGRITTPSNTQSNVYLYIQIKSGTTCNNLVFKPQLFDLTLMNLENISVSEFTAKYNKHYPYNAGSLYFPIVSKIESWGANLFDGEIVVDGGIHSDGSLINASGHSRSENPFEVIAGKQYTFEDDGDYAYTARAIKWYSGLPIGTSTYLGESYKTSKDDLTVTAPNGAKYAMLCCWGVTAGTTLEWCFHLGTASIGYKPYVGKLGTINLPSAPITLRGVNSSQDELVFVEDGQGTYTAKIVRKMGQYTFTGNETVIAGGTSASGVYRWRINALSSLIKPITTTTDSAAIVCSKYYLSVPTGSYGTYGGHEGISVDPNGVILLFDNSFSGGTSADETGLLAKLNGVSMDYELATPTEETLATGLTYEQVSLLFEEGGYMQVENTNSDYTHADSSFAFAVKNYRSAS